MADNDVMNSAGRNSPESGAPDPKIKRLRTAKGRRPYFFDDPNIDRLLAMLMSLAGEISVLRDRLDTHERLAEKRTWSAYKEVEAFEPSQEVMDWRDKSRADYLDRILRIMADELDGLERQKGPQD